MNPNQRRLTLIIVILFVLTLLATPVNERLELGYGDFQRVIYTSDVRPIFALDSDHIIRFDALLIEWIGLAVIYAGLFMAFRKTPEA